MEELTKLFGEVYAKQEFHPIWFLSGMKFGSVDDYKRTFCFLCKGFQFAEAHSVLLDLMNYELELASQGHPIAPNWTV